VGVENSPVTNTDGTPEIYFEVSDAGGSNLNYVQVWRKDGACTSGEDWNVASNNISVSGASDSDTWSEPSTLSNGTYCYGIHVYDNPNPNRWSDEESQGPIEVVVSVDVPDCTDDSDCSRTTCPADGCVGVKWGDYPRSVANTCEDGTCTNNSCTYTESCDVDNCSAECQADNCSTSQCDSFNGQT